MTYTINLVIKIVIATAAAILFGNGSVVAFNHIPEKWFEDWDDNENRVLPPRLVEADNAGRQRLPSTPWKFIFMGMFMVVGVYLAVSTGAMYEIASLCTLVVLLEMAISDQLYKIVPDQLQILLAVTALGFIFYNENWWEPLAGAGLGLLIGLSILGLGLIFKSGSLGGADIKFFAAIGLILGRRGVLIVFILTTLIFAIESTFLMITRRCTLKDHNAMLPAGFIATLLYLLF